MLPLTNQGYIEKGFFPTINILSGIIYLLLWGSTTTIQAQTTFSEVAATKGINLDGSKDGGFTFADFNNDGYLDLLVNTNQNDAAHRSRLYFSDGPPNYTFRDVTTTHAMGLIASGLPGSNTMERCAVTGDLDNDGDVDFIRNTSTRFELYLNNGAASSYTFGIGPNQNPNFELHTPSAGNPNPPDGIPDGMNTEGIGFFDYDNDGDLDIMIENHNWGIDIYQNEIIPTGTFSLTHVTPGTDFPLGLDQTAVDGDYGSVTDFDDDGYIDIVARKKDMEDFWRNNGDNTFSPVNWVDQQADNGDKGAVSLYDYDNDGDYDLMWTDNDVNQIWQQTGVGSGTFVGTNEPAISSGITLPTNGIDGLASGDIDNDGDIDLFLSDDRDSSYLFINETPPGSTSLTFVRNNCDINVNGDAEGAAFVDFDQDGDLDLYININNGDNQLWINELKNNEREKHLFVRVFENVNTTIPNRAAIGANVILRDCDGHVVSGIREVNGGNGHGTQDPSLVHFGLPNGDNRVYIVEVHYPFLNGNRQIAQFKVVPKDLGTYHVLDITPQDVTNAPVAVDDNGGTIIGDQSATYDVLDNDYDTEGDDFEITAIVQQPASGTATIINGNTEIQFDPGGFGNFTIRYQICEIDCAVLCSEANLTVTVIPETDYGDAPLTYGDICYTIDPFNSTSGATRLGNLIDGETNMQSGTDADGDDNNGSDDDDGIHFIGGIDLNINTSETITFSWTSNDIEGHIFGWIDFNGNNTFDDPTERVIDNFLVGSGTINGSSGSSSVTFTVPTDAICGASYARFTIQSDLSEIGPTGNYCGTNNPTQDGEVEDYLVNIVGCIEICDNGTDDDGDGLIDCDDPDCYNNLAVVAGIDQAICIGDNTTISATASGGDGTYTFAWNNGLGTGMSKSVSPTASTTYTVTLTDGNGCTATDQVIINVVNNFTSAGTIGIDEINCGVFNPNEITEITGPSGNMGTSGSIEYRWQARSGDACTNTWNTWTNIPGATNSSYDPPTISISTQYRRQVRHLPCTNWLTSNIVTKSFDDDAPVISPLTDLTVNCDAVPAPTTPSATDNCDAAINIEYKEVIVYHSTNNWRAQNDCAIEVSITNIISNDQGTSTTADDELSFELTVIQRNGGTAWSATLLGNPISGTYFQTHSFGPFLINGMTNINFEIIDNTNTSCRKTVAVHCL